MRSFLIAFATIGLMIVLTLSVSAGDVLNYQGRLTDAAGTTVPDGNYNLTFRIYNAISGGTMLWSDQFTSVPAAGGLFSVQLGGQAALDVAAWNGASLYLEIQVGASAPLTPRTLLTSSPRAARAGKLDGTVETGESSLTVKRSDGESAILLSSSLVKGSIRMFAPQPEPPKEVLEVISMPSNGASIRMFAPQPEPPRVLLDLLGDPVNGPSMGFYDDAGEVMGLGPSPFNGGFGIKLLNPLAASTQELLSMKSSYNGTSSSAITMSGSLPGSTTPQLISMNTANGSGTLRIGHAADPANSGSLIRATGDATESRLEITGPTFPGAAAQPITMLSNSTTARVGIGTSTPSMALQVIGSICYTGTIGACSDAKYKRDVTEIDEALDAVMQLRGVKYNWRDDEYPEMQFGEGTQVGFIAQEVKEVLPEAVMEQPDGSLSVDYSRVTPLLLEALKELRGIVNQQQTQIEQLKERMNKSAK